MPCENDWAAHSEGEIRQPSQLRLNQESMREGEKTEREAGKAGMITSTLNKGRTKQ